MGAQHPALQQGRHPMHPGQECRRGLPAPADHPGLVRVSLPLESLVSFPSIRLAHFDLAGERAPTGSNHGASELLEASPGRPITSEPEQPLQSKGADPVLLVGEPPHGAEPSPQGKVAPVKDRSGRDGGLVSALSAHHERSFCSPSPGRSASGAAKPCWPAHLNQICTAGVLRRKPVLEFGEGVGGVLRDMIYYMWGALDSRCY